MSRSRLTGPVADDRWARLTAVVGLAGFVVFVYAVIVLGGGALVGRTGSPSLPLSLLATGVVAVTSEPLRRWMQAGAERMFQRSGSSPYDILSRFSETVTGGYATEDLPDRMVQLLGAGTNAASAQLWLMLPDRMVLTSSWPPEPTGHDTTGTVHRVRAVRHGGRVYG